MIIFFKCGSILASATIMSPSFIIWLFLLTAIFPASLIISIESSFTLYSVRSSCFFSSSKSIINLDIINLIFWFFGFRNDLSSDVESSALELTIYLTELKLR